MIQLQEEHSNPNLGIDDDEVIFSPWEITQQLMDGQLKQYNEAIERQGEAFSDAIKQVKDVLIDRKSKESTKELVKCLRNELEKERGECRKDKEEAEKQCRVEAEEQRRGYKEKLRKEKAEL